MRVGGQNRDLPSTIYGTPMMASGASCEPSSDTQGSPTAAANPRASADLPIPGGPQMNTGINGATSRRKAASCAGVSEAAASMGRRGGGERTAAGSATAVSEDTTGAVRYPSSPALEPRMPPSSPDRSGDASGRVADLEKLLDVARRLGATTELDPLLGAIAAAATAVLDCERASVFLLDRAAGELVSRVATGMEDSPIHEIRFPVGVGIAGEVARSGAAVNLADAYADPRFNPEFDRKSGFRTRSMLAVPLADHDATTVGVLQVLNKSGGPFTARDEGLAAFLGSQAGVAVQRQLLLGHLADKQRIERDLAVARGIQQSLLPKAPPDVPGFDIAGWNRPADETGGDYFDFVALAGGGAAFAIADATGHGIGPALVAAEARALFRALVASDAELAPLVGRVNDLLCEDLPEGRFVTVGFGIVDPDRGSLRLLSAGQGPLLVYRATDGAITEIDSHGLPLGLMPGMPYDAETVVPLAPGDMLVLLTDGFYEWAGPDGVQFGTERVAAILRHHAARPAAEVIDELRAGVEAFAAGTVQGDDLTAVIVKRRA